MGTALQMPVSTSDAQEVGPKLFRKQVLRVGRIPYRGRVLEFSRDYLAKLARHFREGAYDQVPFVLADGANKHNEDPERFRGEVRGVELSADGLDVIVELTDEGAQLVRKNPRLGVSARIVEVAGDGGPKQVPALRHVCGTLDPHVSDLRPWEAISNDSVLSVSHSSEVEVIDLTTATYMSDTKTLTDEQLKELQDLKPEERAAKAQEFIGAAPAEKPEAEEGKGKWSGLKKLLGIPADADEAKVDEALGKLADGEGEPKVEKKEGEPVGAALSKEAQDAIDLANQTAADAKREAAEARKAQRESEYTIFKNEMTAKGVPPADIELCKPLLMGEVGTIDLSNGEKADTVELAKKLLEAREGTIDLSESGSPEGAEDDESKAAKEAAKDESWEASV